MKNEKETMNVIVHKANIPMQGKESIGEFSNALNRAAKKHILQKMNIGENKGGSYLVEAYADKVVSSSYKYDDKEPTKYHRFSYTRRKDGVFDFGDTVEVKRVTNFEPAKQSVSITKATDSDGWEEVKKSLFSNIV